MCLICRLLPVSTFTVFFEYSDQKQWLNDKDTFRQIKFLDCALNKRESSFNMCLNDS